MKEQNFKSHARYVAGYHFIIPVLLLVVLIGSIVNIATTAKENMYSAALILLISVALWPMWWFLRVFALRAQDRAIRSEENLRHFISTGKALPGGITMQQIIALRFASDEEFPALVSRTAGENLSSKDIKQAIANWRADHHRA